jgi:hypothetical protein
MAGRSDLSSIVALRVVQSISMRMGGFGSPEWPESTGFVVVIQLSPSRFQFEAW